MSVYIRGGSTMKCYCYESNSDYIFCVEDVGDAQLERFVKYKGWEEKDGKLLMPYPQHMFSNSRDKDLINDNFFRLGQAVFESGLFGFDWGKALEKLAQKFEEGGIEWYLIGSASDAVRGVDVKPGDIDIVVHTKDYGKVRNIFYSYFSDSIISPFSDNKGLFPLQYIARLFLDGALFEIAADEKWNLGNRQPIYEKITWRGYNFYVEALQLRYEIETWRKREDRIKAIEAYMNRDECHTN